MILVNLKYCNGIIINDNGDVRTVFDNCSLIFKIINSSVSCAFRTRHDDASHHPKSVKSPEIKQFHSTRFVDFQFF